MRRGAARLGLLSLAALACAPPPGHGVRPAQLDHAALAQSVLATLDASVDPCDDFYQYACGGWIAAAPPPADRPQVMRSFTALEGRQRAALRRLLERPGEAPAPHHRLAADYYASCLDIAAVEAVGVRALDPWLAQIEEVEDLAGFLAVAARLLAVPGATPLVAPILQRDPQRPGGFVLLLVPAGVALPDDERVDDYRIHVARMFEAAGAREVRSRAEARDVVDLERRLAAAAGPREPPTAPVAGRAALAALDPGLPWDAWFGALGEPRLEAVVVANPDYVRGAGAALRATSPAALRAYLRWRLLDGGAERLSRAFDEEDFAFEAKLTGATMMPPRDTRCEAATRVALPDVVARVWAEAAVDDAGLAAAQQLVDAVESSLGASLAEVAWMDEPTRAAAQAKAAGVLDRVGHPRPWPAPPAVAIDRVRYFENAVAVARDALARDLARVGAEEERGAWHGSPLSLHAAYDPLANALFVPAGALQPPFFHRGLPAAMRFGALGAALGHELWHAIDAQGGLFDAEGRPVPWWADGVGPRFDAQARCVVEQYDAFEIAPGLRGRGALARDENVADLAGLVLAWRAFSAQRGGEEPSPVPGLSAERLFFVAYAQAWCARAAPGFDAFQAQVDPHARPRFRVDGPLANLPAFRESFACPAGAPMAPERVCRAW